MLYQSKILFTLLQGELINRDCGGSDLRLQDLGTACGWDPFPRSPFTILRPQNRWIDEFYEVRERRATYWGTLSLPTRRDGTLPKKIGLEVVRQSSVGLEFSRHFFSLGWNLADIICLHTGLNIYLGAFLSYLAQKCKNILSLTNIFISGKENRRWC